MQTHPFNIGQKPRQEELWHWAERTQNRSKNGNLFANGNPDLYPEPVKVTRRPNPWQLFHALLDFTRQFLKIGHR
ncbi:MAG: hypothetical protein ACK5NG_08840 [Chthoniobacterales bacterium]